MKIFAASTAVLLGSALLAGCGQEPVSFKSNVKPILDANCAECHIGNGAGLQKSGLSMESYESLMRGTKFGSVVKPGDSVGSTLNILVEGRADPSIKMPHGKRALTPEEIATLKNWVDQGAKDN
ncbi:MAG: hypothetical protein KDH88_04970 [Chromatiales bacterium]|nr:hypothetical protein [Chromatiales bacterium]